jgi:hypothetical protein
VSATTPVAVERAAAEGAARAARAGLERSWCALVLATLLGIAMAWRGSVVLAGGRRFTLFDDAMVSMTYARNLARGDGLVWNAGEPGVEGITNVLWTLVMAGVHVVVSDRLAPLVMALLGLGLVLLTALLARRVSHALTGGDRSAGVIAVWVVALYYPLVFWSVRGMEVGLLTALTLAIVVLVLDLDRAWGSRRAGLCGAAFVLGVGARPDFVVVALAVAAWALYVRADARLVVLVGSSTAGAAVLLTLWRLAYYGESVPNTYRLKLEGVPLGVRLERGLAVGAGSLAMGLALAVALAVAAWFLRPEAHRGLLLCGAVGGSQLGYSTWVGGDAWEWMRYANRFVVVGAIPLLCAATVGIASLTTGPSRQWLVRLALVAAGCAAVYATAIDTRWPWNEGSAVAWSPAAVLGGVAVGLVLLAAAPLRLAGIGVTGALLVSLSLPALTYWWQHGGAYVRGDAATAELGLLVERATEPGAHVAVVAAGGIVYHSDRLGVDVLGKSDPRIARLPPRLDRGFLPGHVKWDHEMSIAVDRPDLIAQLRDPTADELARIEQDWGYVCARPRGDPSGLRELQVLPTWWVLADSTRVRWSALEPLPAVACRQ